MSEGLNLFLRKLEEDIITEYNKEIAEEEYKPFDDFLNQEKPNLARSKAILMPIFENAVNMHALASLIHRENEHGEDTHTEEKELLISTMDADSVAMASERSWWLY